MGYQVGRIYTGGPVNTQAASFSGYTVENIFQVRHGESLKEFIMVEVGFEPTTQKTHGLPTTPFVKVIGRGNRVPPTGLPIEQVLGEYSLSLPS